MLFPSCKIFLWRKNLRLVFFWNKNKVQSGGKNLGRKHLDVSPCKRQVCENELFTNWNGWTFGIGRAPCQWKSRVRGRPEVCPMPSSVLVSRGCGYIAKLSVHFQSHFSLLLKSFVAVTHSVAQGGLELILCFSLITAGITANFTLIQPPHYSGSYLKTWFYVYKCFADIYVCALWACPVPVETREGISSYESHL